MRFSLFLLIGTVVAIVGCASPDAPVFSKAETSSVQRNDEPNAITVQHCLIGFSGSLPGKNVPRSKEEAGVLAAELLGKVESGEDFDAIIRTYTDDSPPGIYKMANSGLPADRRANVLSRDRMVPAFGNVGFKLDVGEYGLAEYDPGTSPFGWHIIKRLK